MNKKLRSILKKVIPKAIRYDLPDLLSRPHRLQVKKIFDNAAPDSGWLEWDALESLQQEYPFPPDYGYDPESLELRGKERAGQILKLFGSRNGTIKTYLELGCWDGMVSCFLQRNGQETTAIDNRSEGFDKRALDEGVKFLKMDASHLQFGDESFDVVFSYDSFEHFSDPESALREAIRVVKQGGHIYLEFGPLYTSPMGLHAYRSVTVPYCQFLFPEELLKDFVTANRLLPIDFGQLNGWSLESYRKLWDQYSRYLSRIKYHERIDLSGLDLISRYPSYFKSKTRCFDNLLVSVIEVLFQRIG